MAFAGHDVHALGRVASVDVDDAVIATLRTWLPTYLGIIEEKRALSYTLPRPRASRWSCRPSRRPD